MNILKLLNSQNRCLEKILKKTIQFININLSTDSNQIQTNLEHFQAFRETAIKTLMMYDSKISEIIQDLPDIEKTQTLVASVKSMLKVKEELVKSILDNDQKIIAFIEQERTRILKELSVSNKNTQIVKKFKSTWIPEAGEKLDGKL